MSDELLVSKKRVGQVGINFIKTNIYVRANLDGNWGSYDIAALESDSLLTWLRSRGGHNPWAENCVLLLLGHDPIA